MVEVAGRMRVPHSSGEVTHGLAPRSRAPAQTGKRLGLAPAKLAEQILAERDVVADAVMLDDPRTQPGFAFSSASTKLANWSV